MTENSCVPFTHFLLVLPFCKALIYHNENIDVDTVKIYGKHFHPCKNPSCCLFIATLPSFLPTSLPWLLTTANLFFLYMFCHLKNVLYIWNHRACNLSGLVFFTQYDSLEIPPGCACINNVLFSGWVAFQGRNVLLFVNHLPVERQRNCFQFWAIMNKDAVNFQCTVLFKHKFSFLLAKCPRVQLLDCKLPVYFYKKLVKVFSSLAVSFCIFTSSVWMNEFLFIFSSIFF